jgi:hypothetical protein
MANHIHSLSGEQCAVFELIENRIYTAGNSKPPATAEKEEEHE